MRISPRLSAAFSAAAICVPSGGSLGTYETGDRRASIAVVFSAGLNNSGYPDNAIVDGITTNNGSQVWFQNAASATGCWIRFDFGSDKIIDEARYYQTGSQSQGFWKWQGSADASTWADIGSSFELGAMTLQLHTELHVNTTAYRYYRLLGLSGTTTWDPFVTEIEFSVVTPEPPSTGLLFDVSRMALNEFVASDAHTSDINPNGWLQSPGLDVYGDPATFRSFMLFRFNQIRDKALLVDADIVYLWDFPFGTRFKHVWTYFGDPTWWELLAPELAVMTSGVRLIDELLNILVDAGLKVGWTLRPQHCHVQISGSLPTDTAIRVCIRLDYPRSGDPVGYQQFWYRTTWSVGGGGTPDDTWNQMPSGYFLPFFQGENYDATVYLNELRRKLTYVQTNFPQVTHFYIDTTVDPAGTPVGYLFEGGFWGTLKSEYPDFVFSQEQEATPYDFAPYTAGGQASSAPYGQCNLGDVGPSTDSSDTHPDAQMLITIKSLDDPGYAALRDALIKNVYYGHTKLLAEWYNDTDIGRIQDVFDGVAAYVPPAAPTWATVPTDDLADWELIGWVGSSYEARSCATIVGGNSIQIFNSSAGGGWDFARAIMRIDQLPIGTPRTFSYTLTVTGGVTGRVQLRRPGGTTLIYNGGYIGSGTVSGFSVTPDTAGVYLYLDHGGSDAGTVTLSNVHFPVA